MMSQSFHVGSEFPGFPLQERGDKDVEEVEMVAMASSYQSHFWKE